MKQIPVIDLFAGPGGLGEGFSAVRENNKNVFKIVLSVEKDPKACETLKLRSFYRYFININKKIPIEYYDFVLGKISIEDLAEKYKKIWSKINEEVLCAELGNSKKSHQPLIDKKIKSIIKKDSEWVLIGGPPCQAYSLIGRNKIKANLKNKNQNILNKKFDDDPRHLLYKEYLKIISNHSPSAFIMENVKGILSSKFKNEKIFPKIIDDLKNSNAKYKYKIFSFVTGKEPSDSNYEDFLIKSENYNIPQSRHRVILLGIREDKAHSHEFIQSLEVSDKVPIKNVLSDLPKLRSGLSKIEDNDENWKKQFNKITSTSWFKDLENDLRKIIRTNIKEISSTNLSRNNFEKIRKKIKHMPNWYLDPNLLNVLNHHTKAHMVDDIIRYLYVSSFGQLKNKSPKLNNFPQCLLPNHKNICVHINKTNFVDRFKVQVWNRPSSTITSHISKDGHYFIHPDPLQCRSFTVREAARIQTFPDNYFFCGEKTSQYTQVGNAVPPFLAFQCARIVFDIFKQ